MAIKFNPGDTVKVDQNFVKDILSVRNPPSTERKTLLERLGKLSDHPLCVSRVYGHPLIKVTVISDLGAAHSPTIMFESEDDLNNSFILIKSSSLKQHTIQAKNGSDDTIHPGMFVCLSGYESSSPQIPLIYSSDQKKLQSLPIFGISKSLIVPGRVGYVLIEGFYTGFNTKNTTILPECFVVMDGESITTVPGAMFRDTAIIIDSTQNGLIYLPKQPGGPYTRFEYRSFSGKGNNKTNTSWGEAGRNLTRLGKESYPDKKSLMPRRTNARKISNTVFTQTKNTPNDKKATDYLWIWGQFLGHDLGLVGINSSEPVNIEIPAGDPNFSQSIPFSRSNHEDVAGTRQQINEQSSYIDASVVYGSDPTRAKALRSNDGSGKLTVGPGNLLPRNTRLFRNNPNNHDPLYYFAGDIRANEQLSLLAMHTLWMREHNRIAAQIKGSNAHLAGDQVYQVARRKVIALMQAITFNEFLPSLLGLVPGYSGYDPKADASIANEFSAGFYRFGPSMVSGTLQRLDSNLTKISEGWSYLRDSFFRPDRLLEGGGIEPLLRGAARQVCQEINTEVVDDLRNSLSGDLVAINIQRGRDHGIPSYNDTRVALGLPALRTFSKISSDVEIVSKIISVYTAINDVDLLVGMLAEDHVAGAMVGETIHAGLLRQFLAIRGGDRFWYENIFSGSVLDEINNTTLSDIIKRNTDISSEIQDDVFHL